MNRSLRNSYEFMIRCICIGHLYEAIQSFVPPRDSTTSYISASAANAGLLTLLLVPAPLHHMKVSALDISSSLYICNTARLGVIQRRQKVLNIQEHLGNLWIVTS